MPYGLAATVPLASVTAAMIKEPSCTSIPPVNVLGVVVLLLVSTSEPLPVLAMLPPVPPTTTPVMLKSTGDRPEVVMVRAAVPRS